MAQLNTYDKCKYFSYKKCPHINNDIMKQATQTISEYNGGKVPTLTFPLSEELDKICADCDIFTLKQ